MPRRERPPTTTRSEHWLRVLVNEHSSILNIAIAQTFGWPDSAIDWRSPCQDDGYAEYYDQAFLDRLGLDNLKMPLDDFWPGSGASLGRFGSDKGQQVYSCRSQSSHRRKP